jgi:hypothetical protein
MTILGISAIGDVVGTSMSGKLRPAGAASFADLLEELTPAATLTRAEVRARDQAHMVKRIAEVGFAQTMVEEQDKQRMMRVLAVMAADAAPDTRAVLAKVGDDFQRNPPDGLDDMYSRIQNRIDDIRTDTPNHLKQRMVDVFAKLKELMAEPDEKLKQLEHSRGLA